jgi:excisionase family DNA binding protein
MNGMMRGCEGPVPYAPPAGRYGKLEPIGAMSQVDEILTADEAAALLKVSTKTLLRLARRRELPASKVGRSWRFVRWDLLRYCAGGREVRSD